MLTYYLKCKRNTENRDAKMMKTKNGRNILSSECIVCCNRTSRFIREPEAKKLLDDLGIKIPLSKIPLLNILF